MQKQIETNTAGSATPIRKAHALESSDSGHELDYLDRLAKLLNGDRCVVVPDAGITLADKPDARLAQLSKIDDAACFVKNAVEPSEIWLRPAYINALFPDWKSMISQSPDIIHITPERDRQTAKRRVFAKGKRERFYVLRFVRGAEALCRVG